MSTPGCGRSFGGLTLPSTYWSTAAGRRMSGVRCRAAFCIGRWGRAVSSPEHDLADTSRILLRKAGEDATAVRELAHNPEIADSIIGFHAQQAVEKWLKALLAA